MVVNRLFILLALICILGGCAKQLPYAPTIWFHRGDSYAPVQAKVNHVQNYRLEVKSGGVSNGK